VSTLLLKPSALFFDLDGTLVDSERDIAEALNETLRSIGRETLALEAILPMIGDGARVLVARALGPDAATRDAPLVERAAAIFQDAYAARPCVFTTLLPGAAEVLAMNDLPRALITNKPRRLTMLILEALGIAKLFGDAIYAGGDGPLKPAPDGLRALARTLQLATLERVWMIGDGPQDVLAGHAAGCVTIAVIGIASRDRVLEAKPHAIVDSLHDVVRLANETTSA
jgi:phosphoglycolate phosphatase